MAESTDALSVFIVLADQPQKAIMERAEAAERPSLDTAERRYRTTLNEPLASAAELSSAAAEADSLLLRIRRAAFVEIDRAIAPSQAQIEQLLAQAGARKVRKYRAINMIAAQIPSWALSMLESSSSVAEVFPVKTHYARLASSVPELGAPAFWNSGWTGAGQSVAVLDTGVRTDHPAFSGTSIISQVFLDEGSLDRCFNDTTTSAEDHYGHGTHVAGIIMSQGSSGWESYQGVAKGVGTLYNIKIGYKLKTSPRCDGGGASNEDDVLTGIEWVLTNTPARIFNYSYGESTTADDDGFARSIDQLADTYGALFAIAAGNVVLGDSTVQSPGMAYNIMSVGAWSSRGTMASFSSRGPTAGGRYKPDIAAPGDNIRSTAYDWQTTGVPFVFMSGTSMAAPHIAGAAALLGSAGVSEALEKKAILLNSTDNAGWLNGPGWGYANLNSAHDLLNYRDTGNLAARDLPSHYQLYRIDSPGELRVTAVWNRHVVGSTSYLNNVDLLLYGKDTNTPLASSSETIQNVEQIHYSASSDVVVKVHMTSSSLGGGGSSEKYGIAFSDQFARAAGPSLNASCTAPSQVSAGSTFVVSCRVTNSGDLPAFSVAGQMTLPAGFADPTTLDFGTIQPAQSSSWVASTYTAPGAGTYTFTLDSGSDSYGESFTSRTTFGVTVTSAPSPPANPSPADGATGVLLTPVLSWTAGSGVASYDVYFGASSPPPFVTNTTGTSYSPGTLNTGTTYYWRVVATNSAGSASSPTWSFTTLAALGAPSNPSPASGATGISPSPALSWTAGSGAASYDVYFGASSPPPFATNTTGTSYSPGTLNTGTTYYWRVVATNSAGSASSPTWSFTTLAAPGAPSNPSPASGATGISPSPALSWTVGSGAASYDVYFGASSPPPFATNTTGTSYSPGTLNTGTTYYWRVVARNTAGSTSSPTWSFTTLPTSPALSFENLSGTVNPAAQPTFTVELGAAYSLDISGTMTLTFTPDSGLPDDPTIVFTNGSRMLDFTILQGSTSLAATLQTGTVAGTITLTVTRLEAVAQPANVNILPVTPLSGSVTIARSAPVIKSVQVVKTGTSFEVRITGYSTPRQITQALFSFTGAAGLQTTSLVVPLEAAFTAWYAEVSSRQYGSAFLYTQPFSVQGDVNAITSISVTLRNATGDSPPVSPPSF